MASEPVFAVPSLRPSSSSSITNTGSSSSSSSSISNSSKRDDEHDEHDDDEPPPQIELKYRAPLWSALPPVSRGEQFRYHLEVLKDGVTLEVIDIHAKPFYLIGRLPICDISLENETISRQHAVLQHRETGNVYIYDLGSVHGTRVNKQPVAPRKYIPIHPGDVIRFGASSRFYVLGPLVRDQADEEQQQQQQQQQADAQQRQRSNAAAPSNAPTILNSAEIEEHEAASHGNNKNAQRWKQDIDFDAADDDAPQAFAGSAWEAKEYMKAFQRSSAQQAKGKRGKNKNKNKAKNQQHTKKRRAADDDGNSSDDADFANDHREDGDGHDDDDDDEDDEDAGDPELSSRITGYDYFLGREDAEADDDDDFLDRTGKANKSSTSRWSGVGSKSKTNASGANSSKARSSSSSSTFTKAESTISMQAKLQVLETQKQKAASELAALQQQLHRT